MTISATKLDNFRNRTVSFLRNAFAWNEQDASCMFDMYCQREFRGNHDAMYRDYMECRAIEGAGTLIPTNGVTMLAIDIDGMS